MGLVRIINYFFLFFYISDQKITFSRSYSGIISELYFLHHFERYLYIFHENNSIVWKTWKSQGILFWNFRRYPDDECETFLIYHVISYILCIFMYPIFTFLDTLRKIPVHDEDDDILTQRKILSYRQ